MTPIRLLSSYIIMGSLIILAVVSLAQCIDEKFANAAIPREIANEPIPGIRYEVMQVMSAEGNISEDYVKVARQ